MKAIKVVTNPITLIISFLLIMISGKSIGGFYVLYLVFALPFAQSYSLLGLAGILVLVFSRFIKLRGSRIRAITNLAGASLLFCSLALFFYNDVEKYNHGTFYQLVPLMTFVLFSIIALMFLLRNLRDLNNAKTDYQVH
ncbi:MAG TPA: hypothetical protein VF622_01105 [Segetibacter sp.]|jgi:hypothetical protein